MEVSKTNSSSTHYGNCLYDYQNGNYRVVILEDGTKIRETEENEFIPEFPENMDVKITDRCDGGCPFCYENSTVNGKHANLFRLQEHIRDGRLTLDIVPTQKWLETLHAGTEIAINGNDLTHPDLHKDHPLLLYYLKSNNVICNLTVNQKHFMRHKDLLKKWSDQQLIYGLGISLTNSNDNSFFNALKDFPNAVIHTIAGIHTIDDYVNCHDQKVLILGYKVRGRGDFYYDSHKEELKYNKKRLMFFLPNIVNLCKVLSFDNLAIEQLHVKDILFKDKEDEWSTFYMGDDGDFTFYIDAVNEEFAKNSCIETRFPINNRSVKEMFDYVHK